MKGIRISLALAGLAFAAWTCWPRGLQPRLGDAPGDPQAVTAPPVPLAGGSGADVPGAASEVPRELAPGIDGGRPAAARATAAPLSAQGREWLQSYLARDAERRDAQVTARLARAASHDPVRHYRDDLHAIRQLELARERLGMFERGDFTTRDSKGEPGSPEPAEAHRTQTSPFVLEDGQIGSVVFDVPRRAKRADNAFVERVSAVVAPDRDEATRSWHALPYATRRAWVDRHEALHVLVTTRLAEATGDELREYFAGKAQLDHWRAFLDVPTATLRFR